MTKNKVNHFINLFTWLAYPACLFFLLIVHNVYLIYRYAHPSSDLSLLVFAVRSDEALSVVSMFCTYSNNVRRFIFPPIPVCAPRCFLSAVLKPL